jgi:RNA polymerase sigma-70 factor (ECF subfamily)
MNENNLKKREKEINELVIKTKNGDQNAFAKLYDIFIDPIYKYVFFRVNDDDAEDIVETVFLRVWENIRGYQFKKRAFSAWIFTIAHNLVVDYYRGKRDRDIEPLNEMLPDTTREHNPINRAEHFFDSKALRAALKNVKRKYRDIIIYKFVNGFSNKEIAGILGKSEGSLRILQFRALKALKEELDNLGVKY